MYNAKQCHQYRQHIHTQQQLEHTAVKCRGRNIPTGVQLVMSNVEEERPDVGILIYV